MIHWYIVLMVVVVVIILNYNIVKTENPEIIFNLVTLHLHVFVFRLFVTVVTLVAPPTSLTISSAYNIKDMNEGSKW